MARFARKKFYKSDLLFKNSWLSIARPIWEIKSSNKKDFYKVVAEEQGFTCECLGFHRWTKCKHIQYVEEKVKLAANWDY